MSDVTEQFKGGLLHGEGNIFDAEGRLVARGYVLIDPSAPVDVGSFGNIQFFDDRQHSPARRRRIGQAMRICLSTGEIVDFVVMNEDGMIRVDRLARPEQ